MNYFLIFILLFITGCGKNLLSPSGTISVEVNPSNSRVQSSFNRTSYKTSRNSLVGPITPEKDDSEFSFTIIFKKMEVSADGQNWIVIFNKDIQCEVKSVGDGVGWSVSSILVNTQDYCVQSGVYKYLRVWYGDTLKARKVKQDGTIIEKTRDDFSSIVSPAVFTMESNMLYDKSYLDKFGCKVIDMLYTNNGKFDINRNSKTLIVFSYTPPPLVDWVLYTDDVWISKLGYTLEPIHLLGCITTYTIGFSIF